MREYEYYEALGAKLRDARRKLHLTIYDVSTALDVDPSTIHRYETGARRIPVDVLGRYAQALGCRTVELTPEA